MSLTQPQTRQGAMPGALISLLVGLTAFGIIIISIGWIFKSSLAAYLIFNLPAPEISLGLLIAASAGFLLGLIGFLVGASCLSDGTGATRSRLCTWFAGTGIGVSLAALLIDFLLISALRVLLPVP